MKRKQIIAFCCLLTLLIPMSAFSSMVGQQLPSFTGKDMNGKTVDLDKIIGNKPIMLVFWASWCSDCKEKVQAVNEFVKKYGEKDIEFIGINVGMNDTEEKARAFIKEHKMTYPNVFDKTGKLSEKYQLNKVFSLILASKKGTIMMQYNTIPEIGDETIDVLNTYVHQEHKNPLEQEIETKHEQ